MNNTPYLNFIFETTQRGFGKLTFSDRYDQRCSIQDSSMAAEPAIWFGVDNTGPHLKGPKGIEREDVNIRMHLTQDMVRKLLPSLIRFAETGDYLIPVDENGQLIITETRE